MKACLSIQKALVRICILTLITSCWISQNSFAQTPAELGGIKVELNKITQAYTKCKQLTLKATSTWYATNSSRTPLGSRNFSILMKGGSIYYKADYMERISNEKYSIILDHKDKTLILDRGADLKAGGDPRKFFKQDEMLKSCSSIQRFVSDANSKGIRFMYKNGLYHSIDLVYNSNTFMIEKVIMVYGASEGEEGARIEINYTLIDSLTPIDNSRFSVSAYVTVDKVKKVQVAPAFREYFFVNHLN